MTTAQLQLNFGTRRARLSRSATRRACNRNPQWWFQRMRQIVDHAFDWQPSPPPRPEQIWFRGKGFPLWRA
jgi:hypothetical protein